MTHACLDSHRQIRLGGLDVAVAGRLVEPDATAWYEELACARGSLAEMREEISAALHELIGLLNREDPDRTRLVSIRRDLFNGNYGSALATIGSLSLQRAAIETALGGNVGALRVAAEGTGRVDAGFDSWLVGTRKRLVECATNESFVSGVAISTPDLIPAINRFAGHLADGLTDKRDRKTERTLLSYVLRAAVKTSPFSTLGPVSLVNSGVCDGGKDGVDPARVSRWSIYPIARVLNALADDPSLLDDLEVGISPYVVRTEGGVEVERVRWSFKDIDSGDDYAACVESTVRIGQQGITSAIRALHISGMTFGELARELASGSDLPLQRSRLLLADLLRLGFVTVPALTCHPHGIDDARVSLARLHATSPTLAGVLAEYQQRAAGFSDLRSPVDRVRELKILRELVTTAYAHTGITAPLPRSVVYEDVVVPAESVAAPSIDIGGIPMRSLAALIDLHEDANLKHALMVGYFVHRWGEEGVCTDVAGFLGKFQSELLDSFEGHEVSRVDDAQLPSDPWLTWGDAWRWVLGRRKLADLLTAQTTTVVIGRGVPVIEDVDIQQELAGIVAEVPLPRPSYRHLNLLLQDTGTGDVVLNDSFGGIGFPISRFSHTVDDARKYTAGPEGIATSAGVTLAEVAGGALFTNLNAHSPLFEAEIVIPGDPPGSRSLRSIPLAELEVRYDSREKRLLLVDGNGMIVHPVYPGYLIPAATPRRHQVLFLFGPTSNFSRKPVDLVEGRPDRGTMLTLPRLRIGRAIISRARVLLAAGDLPTVSPLTARGFEQWVEFWITAGLPRQVFVRILDDSSRKKKPAYLDASMALCFSILSNDIRNADGDAYVEVVEALPLPGSGTAAVEGRDRASESMVGISLVEEGSS